MNNDEHEARQVLWDNIVDKKRQYSDKILEIYKLIVSLSAVMLSLVATLYPKMGSIEQQPALLLQATIVLLFLNILFGLTALYGRAEVHLSGVKSILREIEDQGGYHAALLKLRKDQIILQRMIFSWSNSLTILSFMFSQILLSWYAIWNISKI